MKHHQACVIEQGRGGDHYDRKYKQNLSGNCSCWCHR